MASLACVGCDSVFKKPSDLKKHVKEQCRGQVHQYRCKTCNLVTSTKNNNPSSNAERCNHNFELILVRPPKVYGCPVCGAFTGDFKGLKKHQKDLEDTHHWNSVFRPAEQGNENRLRGLLQQENTTAVLSSHKPGHVSMFDWLSQHGWDNEYARKQAQRLEYPYAKYHPDIEFGVPLSVLPLLVDDIMRNASLKLSHRAAHMRNMHAVYQKQTQALHDTARLHTLNDAHNSVPGVFVGLAQQASCGSLPVGSMYEQSSRAADGMRFSQVEGLSTTLARPYSPSLLEYHSAASIEWYSAPDCALMEEQCLDTASAHNPTRQVLSSSQTGNISLKL